LWAHKNGFTRLNASFEELGEELWRDPQGKVVSAGRIADQHPEWATAKPAAPPPRPKPSLPLLASLNRAEWMHLIPTVAIGIILVGALQLVLGSHRAAPRHVNQPAAVITDPGDPAILGLRVTSLPDQVQIRWNRESPAILASESGRLRITEEGVTEVVPFDQAQLRDGYVAYGPKSNDVDIRLEVTATDGGTTSESVRFVSIP
jgi:hypothetical protein